MSESSQRAKPRVRFSRADSTLMTRTLRKILKQKAPNPEQPNSKESWADKMGTNLLAIASEKQSEVGLKAIRMVIEQVRDLPMLPDNNDSDGSESKAALRAKSPEELETEIKELRERLGSVVSANS